MTEHHVHTSATAAGYCAACSCGWRTVRRTREQRDQDTDAHELTTSGRDHPTVVCEGD